MTNDCILLPGKHRFEIPPRQVVEDVEVVEKKGKVIQHEPLYYAQHSNTREEKQKQKQQQQQAMYFRHQLFDQGPRENKPRGQKSNNPNRDNFDHRTPRYADDKRWIQYLKSGGFDHEKDAGQYLLNDIERGMDSDDIGAILNPETNAEFDSAMNFMSTIKERLDPTSFQTFLDTLYAYQTKLKPMDEMLEKVEIIF